jgi:hypothetical protein
MLAFYTLDGTPQNHTVPALDLTTGLYLGKTRHYLTISYTLRTNFGEVNHKQYRYRPETPQQVAKQLAPPCYLLQNMIYSY